jgi:hypothetical protein
LPSCGAFGGRVLGEDFAAGVGDRLVASGSRLSQQSFELGEDLLDGVEVGGGVVRETDAAVMEESGEGSPARERVVDRLGDLEQTVSQRP